MVAIRGQVTYNGAPLSHGTVLYLPKAQGGRQARGEIEDGKFQLTTLRSGDGAQQGEYDIVIIALEAHPGEPTTREEIEQAGGLIQRGFAIPERYTKAETSGLSDVVDKNHPGTKTIALKD